MAANCYQSIIGNLMYGQHSTYNKVLLIIIVCLRYFLSRTEDSIWFCEKFCSFVFSLLSGEEKGFDKTLCISPHTYGGSNHIMFAELGKEVSQIQ